MKNQPTRELILEALSRSKDLTAHDLAIVCGVGEPAIRFHLRKMKQKKMIREFTNEEPGLKSGRKSALYRKIGGQAVGNVDQLCNSLLKSLREKSSQSPMQIAQTIADNMLSGQTINEGSTSASLRTLVEWLNNHQYSARWEAGKQGPIMYFSNCPYRAIRSGNDVLCTVDAQILQKLSGQNWQMLEHINWEILKGECVFVVKPVTSR
ncbi:MAG TPA: ArsR family transcriptional regulator [Leptolinea sp.]